MQQCTGAPVARYRSRSLSISVYTSRTAAAYHPQHVDVVLGLRMLRLSSGLLDTSKYVYDARCLPQALRQLVLAP